MFIHTIVLDQLNACVPADHSPPQPGLPQQKYHLAIRQKACVCWLNLLLKPWPWRHFGKSLHCSIAKFRMPLYCHRLNKELECVARVSTTEQLSNSQLAQALMRPGVRASGLQSRLCEMMQISFSCVCDCDISHQCGRVCACVSAWVCVTLLLIYFVRLFLWMRWKFTPLTVLLTHNFAMWRSTEWHVLMVL